MKFWNKILPVKEKFPLLTTLLGFLLMLAQWVTGRNLSSVISVAFCCIMSVLIIGGLLFKKKLYKGFLIAYALPLFGILTFYIFRGADAGFSGFSSGLGAFSTIDHPLLSGTGNILTRLLGNLLLAAPIIAVLLYFFISVYKKEGKRPFKLWLARILSLFLALLSAFFVLTMNLRAKPKTKRLWQGHDDYLNSIDKNKTAQNSPNVLFILMDDLGYGDISASGAIYDTPNIDSIADEGLFFENFYSSYSVCTPARFAAMTGRYPYRGFADEVFFPTVNTFSPFGATRIYNAVTCGGNVDGMLGDEISIAEILQSAGYATGAFGKWHLGDYGEYLPTRQGFDYFYGSHHVNDMTPFYFVEEIDGEYEIVRDTRALADQKHATKWLHDEVDSWIRSVVSSSENQPFFAYYASPWPHDPLFVDDEFKGQTGMGDYADCMVEFDYYLGQLFDSLEEQGVLDDTIIMFTSDNGPALEGSTGVLRGGKGMVYEGGQKVPFLMRWTNGDLFATKEIRNSAATLVDLLPTLVELCGISGEEGSIKSPLPADRAIDGLSMLPILRADSDIHMAENPILYMKNSKLHGIQYAVPTDEIRKNEDYKKYSYDVLLNNKTLSFKYFQNAPNDNPVFFDKRRREWLTLLTDDPTESYNRSKTYSEIAGNMQKRMDEIAQDFKENRRGIK